MSIFAPDIANMSDPVPMECPGCGALTTREGLSAAEKQYLLAATHHHGMVCEYRLLVAMKAITDRYPGTQHPLLQHKLDGLRIPGTDEAQVAKLPAAQPELCEMLRHCDFLLECRFPFVRDAAADTRDDVLSFLVKCETCPDQYLVLPEAYYQSIG
jgi:hypothetical protein